MKPDNTEPFTTAAVPLVETVTTSTRLPNGQVLDSEALHRAHDTSSPAPDPAVITLANQPISNEVDPDA